MRAASAIAAAAVLLIIGVAPGCTSDGGDGGDADGPARIDAGGGTGQIWVRTEPGAELALLDRRGQQVPFAAVDAEGALERRESMEADAAGALVLRDVPPGERYVVTRLDDGAVRSEPITVTADDHRPDDATPPDLADGVGYVATRDGTELAVRVTLPGPAADGPYPTVVEYGGGDTAAPGPAEPGSPLAIASALGFATVGVNLRGTGCSGGSFQLWEDIQATDGYDVIEAVAAQPWVRHGRVGLVGHGDTADLIFAVAALRPPSLAAITPMGAFDDAYRSILRPGGVPNEAAIEWIEAAEEEAQADGSTWATAQVDDGDETCEDNLALRGQNVRIADDLVDLDFHAAGDDPWGPWFVPAAAADQIIAPTFLVATWQDERVGGHGASLAPTLPNVERAFITLLNGNQRSMLAVGTVLERWVEFLQLYVARETPDTTPLGFLYPVVAGQLLGLDGPAPLAAPPARFIPGTPYETALAQYQNDSRVRVLFDVGGAPGADLGTPWPGWEEPFGSFPPPEVQPTPWYLAPGGELRTDLPTAADDAPDSADEYRSDPSARPPVNLDPDSPIDVRVPDFTWEQPPAETSLSYVSPILLVPTVMVGSASADLWIRSSEADTDLQVTLSEVRPDGQETFIQSGWLRASQRALDQRRSTALQPLHTQLEADAAPLEPGEFTPVRVEVAPFAHAFRLGSRIRVTISAPGGDVPRWRFTPLPGEQDNAVARSIGRPSAIVLPVVPGADVPTPEPPCPALRGQPCRPFGAPTS